MKFVACANFVLYIGNKNESRSMRNSVTIRDDRKGRQTRTFLRPYQLRMIIVQIEIQSNFSGRAYIFMAFI